MDMGKTARERDEEARRERLEHMREQIESGDLTVRQMTPEERTRWDEHSAASERQSTPEERSRRDAARRKRARIEEMREGDADEPAKS
jgi:hypothetical protein